ncbi:putative galacturonosyltransferase 6 [Abeliophyllum distichum]|uniref:Galacturonosyltransferase 6 n=1 Tax=Abeliophyllum distichum TaxID=126358 RepID=A0ABD1TDE8_9LAMI
MRAFRRSTRISILCLLCVSVFVPIFLLSHRLKHIGSDSLKEFVEDLSIIKHRKEVQTLSAIEQDEGEGLKEPIRVVYKDEGFISAVSFSSRKDSRFGESGNASDDVNLSAKNATNDEAREDDRRSLQEDKVPMFVEKEDLHPNLVRRDLTVKSMSRKALDEKVKEMKDQVVRAKAYLNFSPANSSSHVVKELKLRIKEVERAVTQSTRDSHMSKSSLQKMKAMESTLLKASRIYPDCSAMVKKTSRNDL